MQGHGNNLLSPILSYPIPTKFGELALILAYIAITQNQLRGNSCGFLAHYLATASLAKLRTFRNGSDT